MLAGSDECASTLARPVCPGTTFSTDPVDFDGVKPPPATAQRVLRLYDDAWEGGRDKVELWGGVHHWLDEGNSFLSLPLIS